MLVKNVVNQQESFCLMERQDALVRAQLCSDNAMNAFGLASSKIAEIPSESVLETYAAIQFIFWTVQNLHANAINAHRSTLAHGIRNSRNVKIQTKFVLAKNVVNQLENFSPTVLLNVLAQVQSQMVNAMSVFGLDILTLVRIPSESVPEIFAVSLNISHLPNNLHANVINAQFLLILVGGTKSWKSAKIQIRFVLDKSVVSQLESFSMMELPNVLAQDLWQTVNVMIAFGQDILMNAKTQQESVPETFAANLNISLWLRNFHANAINALLHLLILANGTNRSRNVKIQWKSVSDKNAANLPEKYWLLESPNVLAQVQQLMVNVTNVFGFPHLMVQQFAETQQENAAETFVVNRDTFRTRTSHANAINADVNGTIWSKNVRIWVVLVQERTVVILRNCQAMLTDIQYASVPLAFDLWSCSIYLVFLVLIQKNLFHYKNLRKIGKRNKTINSQYFSL